MKQAETTKNNFTVHVLFGSNTPPIVIPMFNSTGHALKITGYAADLLALVSLRFNFEYTWSPESTVLLADDTPAKKGLISMLLEGKGDVIVGALLATPDRFKSIDFTLPVIATASRMLIPFPVLEPNYNAFAQPFELSVWMGILATFVIIVLVWLGAIAVTARLPKKKSLMQNKAAQKHNLNEPITYIAQVWLCQGETLSYQSDLSVYFIAGASCMAAFVMVQAYSCNLLPLIMAPMHKPLVQSLYDIASVPGLRVAVNRGLAADIVIRDVAKENAGTSFSKAVTALQKTISHCNTTEECLRKVSNNHHVYINGDFTLYHIINQDLDRTGKCHFTLAKGTLNRAFVTWGLHKDSSHIRKIFNIGLLEMDQFGFKNYLYGLHIKKPIKCLNVAGKNVRKKPLGLDELCLAFVLLMVGYGLSISCLFFEKLIKWFRQKKSL